MNPYERLRAERPGLFRNLPGGVEILEGEAGAAQGEIGVVYQDAYITVVRDPVRFPDGTLGTYIRLLGADQEPGVVVLPLRGSDVVLIEHFRHATRSWHLEAPRGFGSPGLSPEENARRELREELGASAEELVPLGRLHPDTGLLAGHVMLYAARIADVGPLDRHEGIRAAPTIPFAEAEDLVRSERITCAFTIAVLSRARLAGLG
ncbi:NUDIX hydrolase [Streptomyces sp. KR80]|uniref:NUDIX hydrolase n=1 Tax=Streptomyces sp. KR80 TaxID=3457426 RepID=UPI003FD2C158